MPFFSTFSGNTWAGKVGRAVPSIASAIGSIVSNASPTLGAGVTTVGLTGASSPVSPFTGVSVNAYSLNNSTTGNFSLPGSTNWVMGTGDYTIEWFQYQTDSNSFPRIFQIGSYNTQTIGCSIEGGTFYVWSSNPVSFGTITSYKNSWQHFAIVRSSGVLRVYRNGTALTAGTANTTNINNSSTALTFGNELAKSTGAAFGGYITSFRWCKGLAVYTGNFTKPTSPLGLTAGANPYGGTNTSAISAGQCVLLLNP